MWRRLLREVGRRHAGPCTVVLAGEERSEPGWLRRQDQDHKLGWGPEVSPLGLSDQSGDQGPLEGGCWRVEGAVEEEEVSLAAVRREHPCWSRAGLLESFGWAH